MQWNRLIQRGSDHYKSLSVEPIDLYKAGGILHDFAIGNIIKYAFRNRSSLTSQLEMVSISDMKKIIHYAEMLISLEEERTRNVNK
uniref:Putative structural protein n=1 Tax=viral metagenome TaxID=1070528 RepID=A0A6H1ZPD6_9ZZZZ